MKKAIVIIQTENGEHKSSIIRTISQILIGLNEKTIINVGELGLSENIASIVEIDHLKIGIASQNNNADDSLNMLTLLSNKKCDVILGVIKKAPKNFQEIEDFGKNNDFHVISLKSNWSEKLEVNYLTEEQVALILKEIERVKNCED
ncbi:MAG: hypothetical protein GQ574_20220 [Crocinitomix sp.]|nr:hypothetical protein [Crocinitomix sp.]